MTALHSVPKNHHPTKNTTAEVPYSTELQLTCIVLDSPQNLPSASAAPMNCVSKYLEKHAFDVRNFNSLLSIKMTSRGVHSLLRSEEARKAASAGTNTEVTQDGTHLGSAHCNFYQAPPGSPWSCLTSSAQSFQANSNLREEECEELWANIPMSETQSHLLLHGLLLFLQTRPADCWGKI